jgi:hypothetical protein
MAQKSTKTLVAERPAGFLAVVEGVAYGPFPTDAEARIWACVEFPVTTTKVGFEIVEFHQFVYVEVPGGRS